MADDRRATATKGDIQQLRQEMNLRFGQVDERLEWMNQRFDRMHDSIDQVLVVLGNIEERLTGKVNSHEQRITRLEQHCELVASS